MVEITYEKYAELISKIDKLETGLTLLGVVIIVITLIFIILYVSDIITKNIK